MRHLLLGACVAATTVFVPLSLAVGCLNDRDTERTEREYKANYEFKSTYEAEYVPQPGSDGHDVPLALGRRAEVQSRGDVAALSGLGLIVLTMGLVGVNVFRAGRK